MDSETYAFISIFILFHAIAVLSLSIAIAVASKDYRRYRCIEEDEKEIFIASPILILLVTPFIVYAARDELMSIVIFMSIIDLIACAIGLKIGSSRE